MAFKMLFLLRSETRMGESNLGFDSDGQVKVERGTKVEPATDAERAQEEWATPIVWISFS